MSYVLAESTANIFDIDNAVKLTKFYAVNMLTAIIVVACMVLALYILDGSLAYIAVILLAFAGQLFVITAYEKYDGCYKKV